MITKPTLVVAADLNKIAYPVMILPKLEYKGEEMKTDEQIKKEREEADKKKWWIYDTPKYEGDL